MPGSFLSLELLETTSAGDGMGNSPPASGVCKNTMGCLQASPEVRLRGLTLHLTQGQAVWERGLLLLGVPREPGGVSPIQGEHIWGCLRLRSRSGLEEAFKLSPAQG